MQINSLDSKNTIRRLQIKIPNFSHSKERQEKKYYTPKKGQLVLSHHQPHSNHTSEQSSLRAKKIKAGQQSKTIDVISYHKKNIALNAYKKQSPRQVLQPNSTKIKLRIDSKSPRSRQESPAQRYHSDRYQKELLKTDHHTSKNIDEVKSKLKSMSSKSPAMIPGKYFKREGANKLEEMNRTLKKMAEQKQQMQGKPRYELKMLKKLGKSQTGDIILAKSNVNGMLVAIKTFRRDKVKVDYLIDQMKIHLYCLHPNILPAHGYHVGRDQVYLVMEYGYCNLYEEILRRGPFPEEKTAKYITQILAGVEYLHRNGIIHRDLKPENVICFGQLLKITDFGWSIKTSVQRRTLCGTLDYISPEVAERNLYDNKIDCWSIGVLMYEMLTVKPPFSQKKEKYDFSPLTLPDHLTKDCRELITQLLKVNPEERISARQALDHCWVKHHKNYGLLFQRRQLKELQREVDQLFHDQF